MSDMIKLTERNVLIPRTSMWSAVILIISAVVSAWVMLKADISKLDKELHANDIRLEKEIELVKQRVTRDEAIIRDTNDRFLDIQKSLNEIQMMLALKQDKRFAE